MCEVKPYLPNVTLVCIDTTDKVDWSLRAIEKSMEQCAFAEVKFLSDHPIAKHQIPPISGLDGYSKFCIRELHKHISTSHALIVQYDGFVLNGQAWSDEFLKFDYIGAPFNPSGVVGNGGFSLRSKKLMEWTAQQEWPDYHPEDSAICGRHRGEVAAAGFKIAPTLMAARFAMEGRSWDSAEWSGTFNQWRGQFGFHSLLTKLPDEHRVCNVFTHSGDAGDVVYGLAAAKALGGGMLFLTPHNQHPYPLNSRWTRMGGEAPWVDNLAPLVESQPYILKCRYTHGHPASVTHDLNRFRIPWRNRTVKDFDSILKLHCDAFNLPLPTGPWLTVDDPIVIHGRPIVVARTSRYQNHEFPWDRLCNKYGDQMVFVGLPQEAEAFRGFAPHRHIPHYQTKDALELARVIAGAKLCVMNQSLPLAIAHGLHNKVITECWLQNSNCEYRREGAVYVKSAGALEAML